MAMDPVRVPWGLGPPLFSEGISGRVIVYKTLVAVFECCMQRDRWPGASGRLAAWPLISSLDSGPYPVLDPVENPDRNFVLRTAVCVYVDILALFCVRHTQ